MLVSRSQAGILRLTWRCIYIYIYIILYIYYICIFPVCAFSFAALLVVLLLVMYRLKVSYVLLGGGGHGTVVDTGSERRLSKILRGAIVNRTYGGHKNLDISLFLPTLFGPIYYRSPVK